MRSGTGWSISTDTGVSLSTGLLVDASGRSAGPARRIGARLQSGPQLIAVWATGSAVAGPGVTGPGGIGDDTVVRHSDRTLIEAREDGWWYGAFLPDGRPVAAFHTAPRQAARLRADPTSWLAGLAAATLLSDRMPATLFETARLHAANAGSGFLEPCLGDAWIACGDAAIAFDPLASHGILNALRTGEMAARTLLATDRTAAATTYEQSIAGLWRRYISWRAALYRRVAHRLPGAFWETAAQASPDCLSPPQHG